MTLTKQLVLLQQTLTNVADVASSSDENVRTRHHNYKVCRMFIPLPVL